MTPRLCSALVFLWILNFTAISSASGLKITVLDADSAPISSAVVVIPGGPRGTGAVVLDQQQLRFKPRFLLAIAGQELVIKNSDTVVHGVHCDSNYLTFNVAIQPGQSTRYPLTKSFSTLLLCHIHAEMRSRLLVLDSKLYGITDQNGQVSFPKLPANTVKVKVWNPHDQYQTPSTKRIGSKQKLTIKLPVHAPKRRSKTPAPLSQSQSLTSFLQRLTNLSKALNGRTSLKSWSEKVELWRRQIFIGQGLRSALRQSVGRSNAFRYESRLRWISESLARSLSQSQRQAVKKVVDQSIAYLQSSLKKN
ncbi:MAG: hypothetical protein P1V97_25730 [Planctomycetota bacterium]|nr:hypothetical protein [Planctomycetota bacterium]